MAQPSVVAEAIRDVLNAGNYTQSTALEDFDTMNQGDIDRQFFLTGPRLTDTADVSGEAHQVWEMDVQVAYQPIMGAGDADNYRFDMADAIAALHVAWASDTTIQEDAFKVLTSDPAFNFDTDAWEVLFVLEWSATQGVGPVPVVPEALEGSFAAAFGQSFDVTE